MGKGRLQDKPTPGKVITIISGQRGRHLESQTGSCRFWFGVGGGLNALVVMAGELRSARQDPWLEEPTLSQIKLAIGKRPLPAGKLQRRRASPYQHPIRVWAKDWSSRVI